MSKKKISIIIPVFNEERTIKEVVYNVFNSRVFDYDRQVIIVDDGSFDRTSYILEDIKKEFNFILVKHKKNFGKGSAIKTALKYVSGNIVLIQDADLEYNPNDYSKLLSAFSDEFPVVYGSRNLRNSKRGYFLYFIGGRFITILFNILFRSNLTDVNTGYKLFRSDIIKNINLESKGFEFCVEVTAKVLKAGYSIKEVPISYCPRKFEEGKKIRIKDGIISILTIIKYVLK